MLQPGATSGSITTTTISGSTLAGTRVIQGINLFAPIGQQFAFGVRQFELWTIAPNGSGGFATSQRRNQDFHTRIAWFAGGTPTAADASGFIVGGSPAPSHAIVLEIAMRFDAGGSPVYQATDYAGNPLNTGLYQVAAGSTLQAAQSNQAVNRLASLSDILFQLPLPQFRPRFQLQPGPAGAWALGLDANADGLMDVTWLSTQNSNQPCRLPGGVDQVGGMVVAIVPCSGAASGSSIRANCTLEYLQQSPLSLVTAVDSRFSATVLPTASVTSPVCIEGGVWWPGRGVTATRNSSPIPVTRLSGTGFFVDLALDSASPVQLVLTEAGTPALTRSGGIRWTPTPLTGTQALTIRQGDALLFQALTAGTWRVDRESGVAGPDLPIATGALASYRFAQAGNYQVTARDNVGAEAARIDVTVVGATLPPAPASALNYQRRVAALILPETADVRFASGDPTRLAVATVSSLRGIAQLDVKPIGTLSGAPRPIVARLGVTGPIISVTPLTAFTLVTSAQSVIAVHQHSDGSVFGSGLLILTPGLSSLSIRLRTNTSGLTFEDGTTSRTLEGSALTAQPDGSSQYLYELAAAASTTHFCHELTAFQDGLQVSP